MSRVRCVAALAALALVGCEPKYTVEKSSIEVLTTLSSIPGESNAIGLATMFPGAASWVEPSAEKVTWHFTHNGQEYGRFIASLDATGERSTGVGTEFEQLQAGALEAFLGRAAEMATEASVEAALANRPVDKAAVQAAIRDELAKNPAVAQTITVETVGSVMNQMTGGR